LQPIKKATSLSDVLGITVTFADVAAAFLGGARSTFQAEMIPGCLQPNEIAQSEQLRSSKYASDIFLYAGKLAPQGTSRSAGDLQRTPSNPGFSS
jgi:lipoate-protein ligase A